MPGFCERTPELSKRKPRGPENRTMAPTAFIIGDPHFKKKNIIEGREFVRRVCAAAAARHPDFIVILGDTLDTHETVSVQAHGLAWELVQTLRDVAETFLIIGNHDLVNASQYLTANHIFNPLKECPGVTVVDGVVTKKIHGMIFTFVPYVANGRFMAALETTLADGRDDDRPSSESAKEDPSKEAVPRAHPPIPARGGWLWDQSTCIFAHQEFRGCKMGMMTSTNGDAWSTDRPPVISGHIHSSQTLSEGVWYPGSAIQHAFGEAHNKRVWFVDFGCSDGPEDDASASQTAPFSIEQIDLGMPKRVIIRFDSTASAKKYDLTRMPENAHVKFHVSGTRAAIAAFRKSVKYTEMQSTGARISFGINDDDANDDSDSDDAPPSRRQNFIEVLEAEAREKGLGDVFDSHFRVQ